MGLYPGGKIFLNYILFVPMLTIVLSITDFKKKEIA